MASRFHNDYFLTQLHPSNEAASGNNYTGPWMQMKNCEEFVAIVSIGGISGTATIDAKLTQATNAAGAGAKDIAGLAITQVPASDDFQINILSARVGQLDLKNGYKFIRSEITRGGNGNSTVGVIQMLKLFPGPAVYKSSDSVKQVVAS